MPRRVRSTAELHEQLRATRTEIRDQVRATRAQFEEQNARITARTGRNLVFAIGFGVVLGVVLLVSLLVAKQAFVLLVMVLVGFGTSELAVALRRAGVRVPRVGTAVFAVLVQPVADFAMIPEIDSPFGTAVLQRPDGGAAHPAAGYWLGAMLAAVLLACGWRLAQQVRRPVARARLAADLSATVLVMLYVAGLGSCAVALTAQHGGQWWTLSFLIVVVATDVFAYVSGLLFGKHPMAPRISPKKTWEGFAGSATAAVVIATVLSVTLLDQPAWFGPLFGIVILITGTLGDLGESMIKRDIGVKDMSSWLPGHGGFLDRIDSILPSAAAALLLFLLVA